MKLGSYHPVKFTPAGVSTPSQYVGLPDIFWVYPQTLRNENFQLITQVNNEILQTESF
jgi:hypothetical protein